MTTREAEERIQNAINVAVRYGGNDGAHHKDWVIDQMVRHLTGCPTHKAEATDHLGRSYTFDELGESEEYQALVRDACAGEDGPSTYSWEVGIAP